MNEEPPIADGLCGHASTPSSQSSEQTRGPDGFVTREEHFRHGSLHWSLVIPRSSEELFDEAAFNADERLPYWADLWPSAKRLARAILDGDVETTSPSIELGCGIALVSMALLHRGSDVLATDYEPDALQFAEWNARRNTLPRLRTATLDWRHPSSLVAPLVVGADLLYERRNADAIAELLPRIVAPGGSAILADPRRPWRHHLRDRLAEVGWDVDEREVGDEAGPSGKPTSIVFLTCRKRHANQAADGR